MIYVGMISRGRMGRLHMRNCLQIVDVNIVARHQRRNKKLLRKVIGKKIRPLSYTYHYESYYKELKHFFDCVRNDLNPMISAINGLKTVELIE